MRTSIVASGLAAILATGCYLSTGTVMPPDGAADAGREAPPAPEACSAFPDGGPRAEPHVVDLALSTTHACALMSDGTLRCRGDNWSGELGDGTTEPHRDRAVTVPGLTGVAQVIIGATAQDFTCVRLVDGGVQCWGANDRRELGLLNTSWSCRLPGLSLPYSCRPSPGPVPIPLPAVQLATGWLMGVCARMVGDRVHCWGAGAPPAEDHGLRWIGPLLDGVIGVDTDGTARFVGDDVAVFRGIPSSAQPASRNNFCYRLGDGTVRCEGCNFLGELGIGTTGACESAGTFVRPAIDHVVEVATGSRHICVLLTDGTVACWGSDGYGEIGDGAGSDADPCRDDHGQVPCRRRPTPVPGLGGVVHLSAGVNDNCAIRCDGAVYCWGSSGWGVGRTDAPVLVEW